MKIRAKTSAVMIAMIMACVALLTACGKASFYEKTVYPESDVTIVSPEETIDEITGDTSCEISDEPKEFYNGDNAPDDVKKDVADAPEAELPSVPDKIIFDVSTDTETPSDDASGANTVTIEYRATHGGYIYGNDKQTVELGAYTEEVRAVVSSSYKWWKFVKWSDGVTTPARSDRAERSFTVTAIFEQEGEICGDFRYRLLPDGTGYEIKLENYEITEVVIPEYYRGLPVREIAENGMRGLMTYVYVPQTVVKIKKYAFYGTRLEKVDGMVNVREIEERAFSGCNNLKKITGLQHVEKLGSYVFASCNSLEYVIMSDTIVALSKYTHVLTSKNNRRIFIRKTQIEMQKLSSSWVMKMSSSNDEIVYIGAEGKPSDEYALKSDDELFDFALTDDGTGYRVSLRDAGVTEALIPSHYNDLPITEIAERGFANSGVVTAYIPYTVKTIGKNAFAQCENLIRVGGLDGVIAIGDEAFADCRKLNGLIFPDSLQKVGARILRNAHAPVYTRKILNEITELDPEWNSGGATETAYIGDGMPDERFRLIYYTTGRTTVEVAALDKTIEQAELPYKYLWFYVQKIQDRGFASCKNLEKITLCSKRLSVIGDEAFSNCINLRAVYGTAYIKTVGRRAFENCPNLKRLILSDNVAIKKD